MATRKLTGDTSLGDRFEDTAARLPGADIGWLEALRRKGIEAFRAHGLPTRKVEAWKYTRLNALAKAGFRPALEADARAPGACLLYTSPSPRD